MNEFFGCCHCGLVKFKFHTEIILDDLYKCDCSLCLKKSITMKSIPKENFFLLSGEKNTTELIFDVFREMGEENFGEQFNDIFDEKKLI